MPNTIFFSIPWMEDPRKIPDLVETVNSRNMGRRISSVFFRPSDLAASYDDSIYALDRLRQSGIGLHLTTTSRSGIISFEEDLKKLAHIGILPDKLIVDHHSIDAVAENDFVRENNMSLYISAIMGIREKNIERAIYLKKRYPSIDTICMHHDAIFDKRLKEEVIQLRDHDIEPILLANESCIKGCSYRKDHYENAALKHPALIDTYQCLCLDMRNRFPKTLKALSGFIHPLLIDDVSQKTGISHFKLTGMPSLGRQRLQQESKAAIEAYLCGDVPKDLMEITCFTYLRKDGRLRMGLDEAEYFHYQKDLLEGNAPCLTEEGITLNHGLTRKEKIYADYARRAHRLNCIYEKYADLPWTNLNLPADIKDSLQSIPKDMPLLFSGCGRGELAGETYSLGYHDIVCTDISEAAIRRVRRDYPSLESYAVPTEELSHTGWKNKTTFDLHNLHQVSPEGLEAYLDDIQSVSEKIIISWIYEPNRGRSVKSDIDELGMIHHHSPNDVIRGLGDFYLKKQFSYKYQGNPSFFPGGKPRTNSMYCLILKRS